jgi:tetraacyldisaccharide 4'-kinase
VKPPWESGRGRWHLPLAELAYRAGVRLKRLSYDMGLRRIERVPVPVICVGTLTVGGTGKTPAVIAIARRLAEWGKRPAIVSRGFGGAKTDDEILLVSPTESDWRRVGDEALLTARMLPKVPVFVGVNRAAAARRAIEQRAADVIVLDDGFQHWRFARDVDVVLLDGTEPVGNGHLLPRGPLREPVSALHRADLIVLTKSNLAEEAGAWAQRLSTRLHAPVVQAIHRPMRLWDLAKGEAHDLTELRGKRVVSASGLARNESFQSLLRASGAEVEAALDFADHQDYAATQWEMIRRVVRESGDVTLVTTAKDAVKWTQADIEGLTVWVLEIEFEVSVGAERFWNALRMAVNR